MNIRIGTAGWGVPSRLAEAFPGGGAHLERYARRMNAVEINSSFYRSHRRATYERWAASVPDGFRFAVKLPKAATHIARLVDIGDVLERFFDEVGGLGDRLGPVLVQLPPSLKFDAEMVGRFLGNLRERHDGAVACEPRHASWFEAEAEATLIEHEVARAAADPPAGSPLAAKPGGWPGLVYCRLHGSPRLYFSDYAPEVLADWADKLRIGTAERWCILDNTASGEALGDALELRGLL